MTNIYAEVGARDFAIQAHGDQMYGRMPYSYHLDQVAAKLRGLKDYGWDVPEDAYVVAYLHDVLEDTDTDYASVFYKFGNDVAEAVFAMSKNFWEPDKYLDQVKRNRTAKIVKIADTMCNLQASINSVEPKRVKKYSEQLAQLMEK